MKIELIAWIVPRLSSNQALGSEVPFADNRRRADLVVVSPESISAIEIKSPRDNLDRLAGQIAVYTKMFTEVSLAITSRDLAAVRRAIPRSVGIILIQKKNTPEIIRKPYVRKRLEKSAAATWLTSQHLARVSKTNVLEARQGIIRRFDQETLTKLAISAAYEKIHPRYLNFLNELGKSITEDDVKLLSSPSSIR